MPIFAFWSKKRYSLENIKEVKTFRNIGGIKNEEIFTSVSQALSEHNWPGASKAEQRVALQYPRIEAQCLALLILQQPQRFVFCKKGERKAPYVYICVD